MRATIALVVVLLGVQPLVASAAAQQVCWRDSYGRGVGKIPSQCDLYEEKQGLLCYPKCRAGYRGVLNVCWQNCPAGSRDDGAFCRYAEYGRGVGFPWKFGDALNDRGMFKRCERRHGRGRCEKWGAVAYPKCKPGYAPFGCCICRPQRVNCAGMAGRIDLSCAKKSYVRATITPSCSRGRQYDAGLCYPKCKSRYNGVGPVCWGRCPASHPVDCGAACATSSAACANAVTDQVVSVLDAAANLALTVATLGTGTAAKSGATSAARAAKLAAKKGLESIAKHGLTRAGKRVNRAAIKRSLRKARAAALRKGGKAAREAGKLDDRKIERLAEMLDKAQTAADAGPGPLALAEVVDPTGLIAIVNAYNNPICAGPRTGRAGAASQSVPTRRPDAHSSQQRRCQALVQGKIAWNYRGNKRWAPANVARLCAATRNASQPAACFRRVMHGGINWGGGTRWQWKNALELCAGSNDAKRTVACFQRKVAKGWRHAIGVCRAR